jgi:predicted N-formylglutamate amidohydrolase
MMRTLRPLGKGPFVIFCDHASNFVPPELHGLGLPKSELQRHIAWDIGAAGVTEILSEILDSPAVLSGVSRLVVDCNRHLDASDLIPEVSDGTVVPGNQGLSEEAKRLRVERWFQPYHEAVEAVFTEREQRGEPFVSLSVHSMTPEMAGVHRAWQISLSSSEDRSLAEPLLRVLREAGDVTVGDNEPYDLDPAFDYSTPFHALRRGLRHLQVEFRQDEISDRDGQEYYARVFANALRKMLYCC